MPSLDELKEILKAACSQDQSHVQWASTRLTLGQAEPGFFSSITKITVDRSLPVDVRLQSILCLKNALDGVWRNKLVSDEEKRVIRSVLLSSYNDENNQISLHIAVVISKIARFDCPQNWPELVPELAGAIDGSVARADNVTHERALFILYYVVKTLASKRLAVDKRVFHELCTKVFDPVLGYWKAHLSQAGVQETCSSSAALCLKTLRYMVVYGFSDRIKESTCYVDQFLQSLGSDIQIIAGMVAVSTEIVVKKNLQKIVMVALKLIIELQEHSPLEFVRWMPPYLDLANSCAFGSHCLAMPSLAHVRAINVMKLVILCQDYKIGTKSSDPDDDEARARAAETCTLFFSFDRVRAFCQAVIERYLTLTPEELECWREEPERYATTEDPEAWRHMIRPAAESFLVSLVHEYWEFVIPLARSWNQIIASGTTAQNFGDALALDAVLCAIGLSATELNDEIDFDSLFRNFCLPLMSTRPASEGHKIILRRIIWLCGKLDEKFPKELRPKLYEAAIRIIGDNDEDIVLRIGACDALKWGLDEYDFDLESFRPHMNNSVSALINLLKSCEESDSQLHVVTTLWLLAERAGREISGNIGAITGFVPALWQSDNEMLKGQILNLFTQLVKSLGSDCSALMDGLSIMLSSVLNTDDSSHVYLLEEGLDVWLALVENSGSPLAPQLMSLFDFMPSLLTIQSENLRVCCDIVKAYCLYGDASFAGTYLAQLGEIFRSMVEEMRSEGVLTVLKTVEIAIRCFKGEALAPMSSVIEWCIANLTSEQVISVKVMCAAIISLVSIHNVQNLYAVMASAMNEQQITTFVRKWLELVDLISHDMERSKANGLGLCAWLMLPIRFLDPLFSKIIATLVSVLLDICVEEDGSYVDSLATYDFGVCSADDEKSGFVETEHDKRTRRLRDFDPVYATSMQSCVGSTLRAKKQLYGDDSFGIVWSTVSAEKVQELSKLGVA